MRAKGGDLEVPLPISLYRTVEDVKPLQFSDLVLDEVLDKGKFCTVEFTVEDPNVPDYVSRFGISPMRKVSCVAMWDYKSRPTFVDTSKCYAVDAEDDDAADLYKMIGKFSQSEAPTGQRTVKFDVLVRHVIPLLPESIRSFPTVEIISRNYFDLGEMDSDSKTTAKPRIGWEKAPVILAKGLFGAIHEQV
jgi:hypothetical protein